MKRLFEKILNDSAVLIFYFFTTILLTYPWITRFSTHKLGDDIDGSMLVWNLWWFGKSIFNSSESIFFTNYIFYPVGTGLVFHTLTILNGIFAFIIKPLAGVLISFNILTFLTFLLSGYGMFLLVEYITGSRSGAVIAGFIYAFCPFRMMRVSFINYLTTQWIPFYLLFLIKVLREDGRKYSNIILCSVFLLFNALICEIYGFFAALYTIPFFFFYGVGKNSKHKLSENILRISSVFLIFVLMFFPLLYRMVNIILSEGQSILSSTLENAQFESADLLSYFIPSPLHPLWGNGAGNIMSSFAGIFQETVVFPGFISIILCFCAFSVIEDRRKIIFFLFLAFVSALMSFGPYLHFFGRDTFFDAGVKIPMPYFFSFYLPFFSVVRIPGRYGLMAMVFISIVAGYGYRALSDRFREKKTLFCSVVLILFFEFWTLPFPLISDMKIPEVYSKIKNDKGDFALLHIPLGWRAKGTYHYGYNFTRYQYYQTYHEKRIMDGMLARTSQYNTDYFANLPIISSLVKLEYGKNLTSEEMSRDSEVAEKFTDFYNVKYIVIDEVYERVFSHLSPRSLKNIDKYLNGLFDLELVYERGEKGKKKIRKTFADYSRYLEKKNPPRLDPFYSKITALDTTYKVYRVNDTRKKRDVEITPQSPVRHFYLAGYWQEVNVGGEKCFSLPAGKKGIILYPSYNAEREKMNLLFSLNKGNEEMVFDAEINNQYERKISVRKINGNMRAEMEIPEEIQVSGMNRIEISLADKDLILDKISLSQSR